MKKIISLMIALFMAFTITNAQTVERGGVFSNMYVGINGGAIHNPVSNYDNFEFNTLDWNAGLELGKNVTPITGFSLVGYVMPNFEDGFTVSATNLNGNVKFNLMNLFAGYKGQPRIFEIQTVTGIGWDHMFNSSNPNDISLNAGLEFDFNLGKERAWYITFTPQVVSHEILQSRHIEPMVKHADLQANIGVAYRFKSNKTGSHNFVICDKTYTDQQYSELYTMYDECMRCMNREVERDTVIVEKIVEKIVEVNTNNTLLTFAKNSSTITTTEMQRLDIFMANVDKDANIVIVGSADTKTGTENYNSDLANARAAAVKAILEQNGYTNIQVTTKLDAYDTVELSRCATITRE
jgi:outer membrane protein OmpA-like peptidoglycan-associated protein